MEWEKQIESNGKYYISQQLLLAGKPFEVGKYSTIDPFFGQRVKKTRVPIKLYKTLAGAMKRYNKLTKK